MAIEHWHDEGDLGKRLTAHHLAGLLSIDLEGDQQIGAIGAVRTDHSVVFTWRKGSTSLHQALAELDTFAEGALMLVGHNIIEHDLQLLMHHAPNLSLLKLPAIDTLCLSPLAFPQNPYHHLVKQYQDPALARVQTNDPLLDAEFTLELLADIADTLKPMDATLLLSWHALLAAGVTGHAFDLFFRIIRHVDATPLVSDLIPTLAHLLKQYGCENQAARIAQEALCHPIDLTFLLAWLPVAGGNSIIAPYIEHRYKSSELAARLRNTYCGNRSCSWCSEHLDADKALKRWFGFPAFRAYPEGRDGESLQQSIVEKHLAHQHVLGILPTGTGKSLCYQLPALMHYEATGAITVVISPLVALMADQVAAMRRQGMTCVTTINGLISMPERAEALAHIRLGDAGIVLVAPEQLRSRSFSKAIKGRRVGAWVIDEAHCLSKWGHDFRPDYRYVARFIFENHAQSLAPILCLTATAKYEVINDIQDHFEQSLQARLEIIDGGSERRNLTFVVMPTTASQRIEHIYQAVKDALGKTGSGGAIVYCTTKRSTEETAQALAERGLIAEHFHSGLSPERKREIQRRFHIGDLNVVVATNAFGMGIDKPDVRAVVHAEIPGSLESYLQEAGRAGRDGDQAHCLLLFEPEDTEKQFSLTARSRLERRDIQAVLRALRQLDQRRRRHRDNPEDAVIATSGEILLEDEHGDFTRDSATDDDRVRTAIAWLEESKLAQRDENHVSVFPSSLRVPNLTDAHQRIERASHTRNIRDDVRKQMLQIVKTLIHADPNTGISTDELMSECGCSMRQLRYVFSTLDEIGVASNDMRLTVYVHIGVKNASSHRLALARELEQALIAELREEAPDQSIDDWTRLSLRHLSQRLREKDITDPLPERLVRLLRSIASDGRDEPDAKRSIEIRARDMEAIGIRLRREWDSIERIARLRRDGAVRLLEHLIGRVAEGVRGVDLLVDTTYGALEQAIKNDLVLRSELKHQKTQPLVDHALLWMHEQEVITLSRGLTVFRPAMSLKVTRDGKNFTIADFEPLQAHYAEQTAQIHIANEYAKLGVNDIHLALRLAVDYFELPSKEFAEKWFKGREIMLKRATLPEHYETIVRKLGNRTQQNIVADNRERTNVLVLAGPGSGKTRVLVHRIAYLLRVRRELPKSILALTYNRHAAVEARRRLYDLVGNDARGVNVMTCHALAMQILGISFAQTAKNPDEQTFNTLLRDATQLLRSDEENTFITREQMIGRLHWILVDEYQDIGEPEYELIAALTGKTLAEDGAKLNLFAVGDDDQNIYSWKGASVRFIRRFAEEYHAKEEYLVENYRSTQSIIDAANLCIEGTKERLKRNHKLRVDARRLHDLPGGVWSRQDRVGQGKVQILRVKGGQLSQAVAAIQELIRLAELDPDWQWNRCAIIARNWDDLDPVRSVCMAYNIPAQSAREELSSFWRARVTQQFLHTLEAEDSTVIQTQHIQRLRADLATDLWSDLLAQALDELLIEEGATSQLPVTFVRNWLGEWSREIRRRQFGLLLTSAHRAKGLEFDHVVILDGKWCGINETEDPDSPRRLYYVSMTRTRKTLALVQLEAPDQTTVLECSHPANHKERAATLLQPLANHPSVLERTIPPPSLSDQRLGIHIMDCTMKDVVLSFAGWRPMHNPIHQAIADLAPEDPLSVVFEADQWKILDCKGRQVGRMSRHWSLPNGMIITHASVLGIFSRWANEAQDKEYQQRHCVESWEIVVPTLRLAQASSPNLNKGIDTEG